MSLWISEIRVALLCVSPSLSKSTRTYPRPLTDSYEYAVHKHARTHACRYARTHARTHVCTHVRTHTHTHTHTHKCTHSGTFKVLYNKRIPPGVLSYSCLPKLCIQTSNFTLSQILGQVIACKHLLAADVCSAVSRHTDDCLCISVLARRLLASRRLQVIVQEFRKE